jgi:NhaP-type Na+/H+ or K+/H+ antiporter
MPDDQIIIGLATIVVFGVGAQWIGRRSGIPSLLLLLPAGVLAGAVFGLVNPEDLFGDTLFPGITLLVSLLLFQAALGLRVRELPRAARGPVLRLVTVGAMVTFVCASAGVALVLGIDTEVALLVGAILVVSGPTVVGPLLKEVRVRDPSEAVLRWESIALDPIGATMGVVVLNLVLASGGGVHPMLQMLGRLGVGVGVGVLAAGLLVLVMSRFLVTDEMEAAVALLFAVAAFAVAEVTLSEAGLFATTTLGFIAANQTIVPTARITGFGETLEVLIIGSLFVVLGALVPLEDLRRYAWPTVALVALLVVVVRPLAVAVSLVGTRLRIRDRAFVGSVDPRGIVAAATAAQFSGTLADAGIAHDFVLPVVFGVIVGTGIVYAVGAGLMARLLDVEQPPARGVAFLGDEPWLIALARHLDRLGVPVLVLTTRAPGDDRPFDGLPTASILDDDASVAAAIEAATVSQVLITARPGPAVTMLTASLVEDLGRRRVLDLPESDVPGIGRIAHANAHPFAPGTTRERVDRLVSAGATVEVLDAPPASDGLVLAAISPDGTVDLTPTAKRRTDGSRMIALVTGPARQGDPA